MQAYRGIFSCLNRCMRVPFASLLRSMIAGRAQLSHASVLSKLPAFCHAKFDLRAGPIVACIHASRQICFANFQAYFDRWAGPIVASIYLRDKEKELSEVTRFAKTQRDSGRSVVFMRQTPRWSLQIGTCILTVGTCVLTFSC